VKKAVQEFSQSAGFAGVAGPNQKVFLKAIIDERELLSPIDARFASILEFVADDFDRVFLYLMTDWRDRSLAGHSTMDFQPNLPRLVYLSKKEYVANGQRWETEKGRLPIHISTDELVYSTSSNVCRGALEQQGSECDHGLIDLSGCRRRHSSSEYLILV